MGHANSSLSFAPPVIYQQHLIPVQPSDSSTSNSGQLLTYKHTQTSQLLDRYTLQFPTEQELKIYYLHFLSRYREPHIVSSIDFHHIEPQRQNNRISACGACSIIHSCHIYLQNIPIRLKNITDIPYPDNLYVLQCSLLGFKKLYTEMGYFNITQECICINCYGEVKVWFNANLHINYISRGARNNKNFGFKGQCQLVSQIIDLIQQNTNDDEMPINFDEFIAKNKRSHPNFDEALQLLDMYIRQFKPIMPIYCQSIYELFKEQKSQTNKLNLPDFIKEEQQSQINRGSVDLGEHIISPETVKIQKENQKIQENSQQSQHIHYNKQVINKQLVMKKNIQNKTNANHVFINQKLINFTYGLTKSKVNQSNNGFYQQYNPYPLYSPSINQTIASINHTQLVRPFQMSVLNKIKQTRSIEIPLSNLNEGEICLKKCYYSTQNGLQEIDNQISDDLAKYL